MPDVYTTTKGAEMPKAWSKKDERKYQHVKASTGSKRIAAAKVNKDRKKQGRTKSR